MATVSHRFVATKRIDCLWWEIFFNRQYILPEWVHPELLRARMSDDGTLTVEIPLPQVNPNKSERLINITNSNHKKRNKEEKKTNKKLCNSNYRNSCEHIWKEE